MTDDNDPNPIPAPLTDHDRAHVARSWSHLFAHLIAAKECFEEGEYAASAAHLADLSVTCELFGRRFMAGDSVGAGIAAELRDMSLFCDEANRIFEKCDGRLPPFGR